MSKEREIEILGPVRDVYRLWRLGPMYRAHGLEKAMGTTAKIFYKYKGMSPAGSHKPTTAIPQAFYNREAGLLRPEAVSPRAHGNLWRPVCGLALRLDRIRPQRTGPEP